MNEKPTYELDKILSSVEPEHFNRYRNEEDTDSQMSVSEFFNRYIGCLLYTSPSPRDRG